LASIFAVACGFGTTYAAADVLTPWMELMAPPFDETDGTPAIHMNCIDGSRIKH
jgi:hypothetical protein